MDTNNHINYIEMQTLDIEQTKQFYEALFHWNFIDYWPTYIDIQNAGLAWGFELVKTITMGWAMVILYHENLEEMIEKIPRAWGSISKNIFSFPGWERFEFLDPSGNKLAIWRKK